MRFVIAGVENKVLGQMVALLHWLEDVGVLNWLELSGLALRDDEDFVFGDTKQADDVGFGVLGDGDNSGGALAVVFGEMVEVSAFEGAAIVWDADGVEVVDGDD